jgi:hypothetical protein
MTYAEFALTLVAMKPQFVLLKNQKMSWQLSALVNSVAGITYWVGQLAQSMALDQMICESLS